MKKDNVMNTNVYICSAARSGSTLLDMILGGHSQAASLGEFSFIGKTISLGGECSCGKPLCKCNKWQEVFQRVEQEKGVDFCKNPYQMMQWDTIAEVHIDEQQQTKSYVLGAKLRSILFKVNYMLPKPFRFGPPGRLKQGVNNSLYLYETISKVWNKSIIIDSTKNYNQALALYEAEKQKTKVILLVRDGRGVFYSRLKSGFTRQQSLDGWYNTNKRAFRFLEPNVPSSNLLLVHYENLVTDLEGTLHTVCEFLDIEYEEQMFDVNTGDRHLVNGNNGTMSNWKKGIKLDERWKTELSAEDLEWFMANAGDLNKQLGYS